MPDLEAIIEPLIASGRVSTLLDLAIEEDLGEQGDITTKSIVELDRTGHARLITRQPGVLAGIALVEKILDRFRITDGLTLKAADGQRISTDQTLAVIDAPLARILTAERTVLNVLGRLCGVATKTRRFVDAVSGTKAEICDTRKTTPGWRALEKYAVACGGGTLHRMGLYDAALYKDNHLAHIPLENLRSRLVQSARQARSHYGATFVEVECDTLEQFEQVLGVERGLIDYVLLDNMSPDMMRDAVAMRNERGSAIQLEASGGIALDTVRAVAETGVERISVGAMTHSASWLDLSLDIESRTAS